jgi:hypothetical protein
MRNLTPDARLILTTFAEADGPVDWNDVVEKAVGPEPEFAFVNGGRQQGYRAWVTRRDHLIAEIMLLIRDELLAEVPDARLDTSIITTAGREALAAEGLR